MMTLQMNCENSYDSVCHYDCFHGIELKERMEHDLDDVSRVAQGLKVKVEALDRANISNRKIKGCHEGSSTDRTRMSITA
jgi:hypothetical protein